MFERQTLMRALMAAADKGGTGGADDGDDGDDDKFTARFNKLFHAAMKTQRNKIVTEISDSLGAQLKETIPTLLADARAKDDEARGAAGAKDDGKGGASGALHPDVEKRLKLAEEKAERAEKKMAEERAAREQAQQKSLRDEEYSTLVAGLTERGVRKALIPMAAKELMGRVFRDEKTGAIRMKGMGQDDDDADVVGGLDGFIKSDYGKELLPARDVGGSGNRGAGAGAGANGKQSFGFEDVGAMISGGKR